MEPVKNSNTQTHPDKIDLFSYLESPDSAAMKQISVHFDGRNNIKLHIVVCDEEWEEVNEKGKIVTEHSQHAWISDRPINRNDLHERCNLAARHRWGIETCILVEKHQGYHYEHCFAFNRDAMKGYHYLMRLAHVFNTLARFSIALTKQFKEHGVRGFIAFVRNTLQKT